jgi:hypothetical protein
VNDAARVYLIVTAIASAVVLGVPMTFLPRHWARAIGWPALGDTAVFDYLTRSLGAIGLALAGACAIAASSSRSPEALVGLLVLIGAGASVVHTVGALAGRYPRREALEVPALIGWTLWGAWVWLLAA